MVSLGHPGPTLTDEFEVFAGVLPLDAINFGIAYTQPAMQNPATGAYIDLFQSFIDNA